MVETSRRLLEAGDFVPREEYLCSRANFQVSRGLTGEPQLYFSPAPGEKIALGSAIDFLSTLPDVERDELDPYGGNPEYSIKSGNRVFSFGELQTLGPEDDDIVLSEGFYQGAFLAIARGIYETQEETNGPTTDRQKPIADTDSLWGQTRLLIRSAFAALDESANPWKTAPEDFNEAQQYIAYLAGAKDQRDAEALRAATLVDNAGFARRTAENQEDYTFIFSGPEQDRHIITSRTRFKFSDPILVNIVVTNEPDNFSEPITDYWGQNECTLVVYSPLATEPTRHSINLYSVEPLPSALDLDRYGGLPIILETDFKKGDCFLTITPDYSALDQNIAHQEPFAESPADLWRLETVLMSELGRLKNVVQMEYSQALSKSRIQYERGTGDVIGISQYLCLGVGMLSFLFYLMDNNTAPLLSLGLTAGLLTVTIPLEMYTMHRRKKMFRRNKDSTQQLPNWDRSLKLMRMIETILEVKGKQQNEQRVKAKKEKIHRLKQSESRRARLSEHGDAWGGDANKDTYTNLTNSNQGAN